MSPLNEEAQDLRKDIRYAYAKHPDPSSDGSFGCSLKNIMLLSCGKPGNLGFPVCCIERYIFDRNSGY